MSVCTASPNCQESQDAAPWEPAEPLEVRAAETPAEAPSVVRPTEPEPDTLGEPMGLDQRLAKFPDDAERSERRHQ